MRQHDVGVIAPSKEVEAEKRLFNFNLSKNENSGLLSGFIKENFETLVVILQVMIDFIIVVVGFRISYLIWEISPMSRQQNIQHPDIVTLFSVSLLCIFSFIYTRSYQKHSSILNIKELKHEIKEFNSLEDLGKREKDIFKTLRDNEKKVVEFLIEQKEPVYFSKIHYKTGLSKGSLFRNLRSLENKDIDKTIKEGKVRKVSLSDWFLGK